MRVYTRRTARGKRSSSHDHSGTHQSQTFVQRIADSIGLGNSGRSNANGAGSFQHVTKLDEPASFDHASLLSLTACSDEEISLQLRRVDSKLPVPRVIPFDDEPRTLEKKFHCDNWVGLGFDTDGIVSLCVSEDSYGGMALIPKMPVVNNDHGLVDEKQSHSVLNKDGYSLKSSKNGATRVEIKDQNDAGLIRVEQATEVDALKALVRALSSQQQKIAKLEALSKGFRNDKYHAKSIKRKVVALEQENTELQLKLEASQEANACLQSKLNELEAEVRIKARQIMKLEDLLVLNHCNDNEGDKVYTEQVSASSDDEAPQCDPSRLYNEHFDMENRSDELSELQEECSRLRAEIAAMSATHERTERLNESKITILMEMKAALESQVKLLESR